MWPALEELEALTSTVAACAVLGLSRATVYRARGVRFCGPQLPRVPGVQPNALSGAERREILGILNCEEFLDKSPAQVWAVLLDRGRYLGSVSTLYRVLREDGLVRERRAQATHPARVRPELMADGPNQVWSWDITKLKGPARGVSAFPRNEFVAVSELVVVGVHVVRFFSMWSRTRAAATILPRRQGQPR